MTRMICPVCGAEPENVTWCPVDFLDLVPAGSAPQGQRPADGTAGGEADVMAPPGSPDQAWPEAPAAASPAPFGLCWSCRAPVPGDTSNTCCISCGEPLTPPRLVLSFAAGPVKLHDNQCTPLGREPEESPHAGLFRKHRNVSGLHATIGVDNEGKPWIRDEGSLNGTFVNDLEISSHRPVPLADGDRIRLARDAGALVRVYTAFG